MAKPELGNKHQCQNCGAKFFDLNKNPITCPKCGTIFHAAPLSRTARAAATDDDDGEAAPEAELVSLEDADSGDDKIVAAVDDEVEIEVADDTFLEEEEEDGDDVVDLIDGDREDDEEH
ncbi:TIGR02300 family protein [Methylocapsa palsarum]|uniref:TIGR02300 family protein n=1 Tax=Methylocapsa palsarum TaxID=1612308 RepID=A0A1I3YF30_9HYPH|nr:TIGR02300 family protein [Methylocapsa palsarum]SFK29881.1 TIGR02300 family protein [Methylocapsa palsarum]